MAYGLKTSLIRGGTSCLTSSLGLGWKGFGVEHHLVPCGRKEETPTDIHVVSIAVGRRPSYGQRRNLRGHLESYRKEPQSLGIFAVGALPEIIPTTDTELIVCGFEPGFIRAIAEENDHHRQIEARAQEDVWDASMATLGKLLADEARNGGASGALYVDHLAHALALRLLSFWKSRPLFSSRASSLPGPALRRVLDRMHADPAADWRLATLANESGFSNNHFIRMFRGATGFTPHRYLLQLRIEKARSMLRDTRMRLIEIAASCGFANEAHLSRSFRALVGVSPSEYRREISY